MVDDTLKIEYVIKNKRGIEREYTFNYGLARHFAKQVKNQEGFAKIEYIDQDKNKIKEEIV